jgi:hypothetical protein
MRSEKRRPEISFPAAASPTEISLAAGRVLDHLLNLFQIE